MDKFYVLYQQTNDVTWFVACDDENVAFAVNDIESAVKLEEDIIDKYDTQDTCIVKKVENT